MKNVSKVINLRLLLVFLFVCLLALLLHNFFYLFLIELATLNHLYFQVISFKFSSLSPHSSHNSYFIHQKFLIISNTFQFVLIELKLTFIFITKKKCIPNLNFSWTTTKMEIEIWFGSIDFSIRVPMRQRDATFIFTLPNNG